MHGIQGSRIQCPSQIWTFSSWKGGTKSGVLHTLSPSPSFFLSLSHTNSLCRSHSSPSPLSLSFTQHTHTGHAHTHTHIWILFHVSLIYMESVYIPGAILPVRCRRPRPSMVAWGKTPRNRPRLSTASKSHGWRRPSLHHPQKNTKKTGSKMYSQCPWVMIAYHNLMYCRNIFAELNTWNFEFPQSRKDSHSGPYIQFCILFLRRSY